MGRDYDSEGRPLAWSDFYRLLGVESQALPPHGWLKWEAFKGEEWTCDMLLDPQMEPGTAEWPDDFCKNPPVLLCFDATRVDWFPICNHHGLEIAGKTGQEFPPSVP